MRYLPSRHRRLDGALADLPLEEPMLLTELDGFLTGILLSPQPIAADEWMRNIWGDEESAIPPFEDSLDVRWFADAIMARHDEIARDLARGKPQPILDVDERNGDLLWEPWIDGFAEAMALRPDAWSLLAGGTTPTDEALSRFATLIDVAAEESMLDSVEINALQDHAATDLVAGMLRLHALHAAAPVVPPIVSEVTIKIGRNEPCRCGSGRKSKRCCG